MPACNGDYPEALPSDWAGRPFCLAVLACDGGEDAGREDVRERARALAQQLGLPLAATREEAQRAELTLLVDTDGLALTDGTMAIRGDFTQVARRIAPGNLQRELLVRAARVKGAAKGGASNPIAVDATAGLGEDSLLLAAAGFSVHLFERNPVIAALLRDALERGASDPRLAGAIGRMQLHVGDSVEALRHLPVQPDVVLLDPMFPDKRKTASAKKKLQLLQHLERPCEDEGALLDAAIAARPRKVVVKRPVKGPHLAGRVPDYSLSGKAVRYDVITLAATPLG